MTLRLNGDGSGFTEIKAADTAGDNSIKLPASNGSANELLQNGGTAGELQYTSAGGGLHYDSSGRLLVGTSTARSNLFVGGGQYTPVQQLEMYGSTYSNGLSLLQYSSAGYAPIVTLGTSGTNTQGANALVTNGHDVGIVSFVGNDGSNFREAVRLQAIVGGPPSAGVMPGKLVFSTNGGSASPTPRMEIGSNGALKLLSGCPGIDFSGIQSVAANGSMSSETLDSYEEGTWTPSFQGETSAGTYTYGSRAGIYTKVGNIVIVSFSLVNINTSSVGSGTATVTGLPFTSTATFSYNSSPPRFDNFDIGANTAYVTMLVDNNSTRIKFFTVSNNGSDGVLSVTSKNSDTSDVFGTLMYLV